MNLIEQPEGNGHFICQFIGAYVFRVKAKQYKGMEVQLLLLPIHVFIGIAMTRVSATIWGCRSKQIVGAKSSTA